MKNLPNWQGILRETRKEIIKKLHIPEVAGYKIDKCEDKIKITAMD